MMKKALLMIASMTALLTLTGCVVRGPGVWVEPAGYYSPAVIVEPAPTVVVYEQRHYHGTKHHHKGHKKHKRHYHRDH